MKFLIGFAILAIINILMFVFSSEDEPQPQEDSDSQLFI